MSQSQKTLFLMLALVAITGGLGSYAYFGIFKKDQAVERKTEHEQRLFAPQKLDERQRDGGAATADFTKIQVTADGETTVLERQPNKEWWVTSPVRARADRLVIDGITSQLQTAKFKDTLDENPDAAALKKYGLDTPRFVVEAWAETNGEVRSVKLMGGVENTFDGSVYMRRNDEKPVFTAEGGVRFMLAKRVFDLRDKTPFSIDEKQLKTLSVKGTFNGYELERLGERQWNLTKPTQEPGDSSTITAMIAGAGSERAQAFPEDTEAARKAFGFDKPIIDVTATFLDGSTVRLRLTRVVSDAGELYYGLREAPDGTVLAQLGAGASEYDRHPADLHDKSVVRFRRELVTKIISHDPEMGDLVMQKDSADASADSWRVVAPRPGKARVFRITGALWTLGAFKALSPGEEHPKDLGRYGLDAKARWIAVYGEDGKELARLTIGKQVPNTPTAFWVKGTRDQVVQSDGSRFGELPFSINDVIDEPGVDGGPDGSVTSP